MATRYGHLIKKWAVPAVAALAVMAALLATALPAWGQDAPPSVSNAETQFTYDENGTGPITTYSAADPEGNKIFWTLGGPDADDFKIEGGVLRFKRAPNFEVPTDRANDENDVNGIDPATEGEGNNVYKVTVRIGAGGEDGAPDLDEYAGDDLEEIELTVIVDNVNEDGKLVISPRQPQIGTLLTAILTDDDNVAPGVGDWQWARSDSENGPWEDILSRSNRMTYSPTSDDDDKYLQVRVRYVDRAGAEPRNLDVVSEFKVREDIVTSNDPPKFPDQSTLIGGSSPTVAAPTEGRTATDRFIPETAPVGEEVGAPVTAFDDKSDIEVLTYSLRDGAAQANINDDNDLDTPEYRDGDTLSFKIDEKSGQITVSDKAVLDADGTDGQGAGATNPYTVVVRAVDGDGDTQDITVTIHVLEYEEPPIIDSVYVANAGSTRDRLPDGFTPGDRVPTEMSHYELDRDNAPATDIDTNLDTDTIMPGEAAIYTAWDPDGDTIKWALDGPDAGSFVIEPGEPGMATLAFESGPNFEPRADDNGDNVYEVTIVATDDTYDMEREPRRAELDVTVKVLNSTDDNGPGTVSFLNRQPEVATELTAELVDGDGPSNMQWQWYRAATATTTGACDPRAPVTGPVAAADGVNDRRYFVENDNDTITGWVAIPGATSATYTPGYDEHVGGTLETTGGSGNPTVETWTGGDIELLRTTALDGTVTNVWSEPKCLRATVTYKDDIDRTHSAVDVTATDVDETLEGTWAATEHPVKAEDRNNNAPKFTDDGTIAGAIESVYRRDVVENSGATVITEAFAAVDFADNPDNPAENYEDDGNGASDGDPAAEGTDDLLTYSLLEELDYASFMITGTITDATPTDATDDGVLTFNGADYEAQAEYRVKVHATDPSGDSGTVTVIINVTPENEGPGWVMGAIKEVYWENHTVDVSTYEAVDPEGSGITYSLHQDPMSDPDIGAADNADADLFEINSIDGNLSFKTSPNFEDPQDDGTDNVYKVTVRAESEDDKDPRDAIYRKVTITVINVREAPKFSETLDDLGITENIDDPDKEPPLTQRYLYLLNRGAGQPAADLPAAPNLDVGIPVVAVDDDNTFEATNYTSFTGRNADAAYSATNRPIQLIDGLTYELSGAGAGPFHIVPATGQILTLEKLDYEIKNEYYVTVKATDPWGLYGTINLTIEVTDVDEVPVGGLLTLSGDILHYHAENNPDTTLGTYNISGTTSAVTWNVEGADASHFVLEMPEGSATSRSRMLKFVSSPNYEMPRGEAISDTNTNTYMVTVKAEAGGEVEMVEVTVMVTNEEEAGTVELSSRGGKVGTPLTAELSDDDIVVGPIEWQWYRVDPATSSSTPITGARSSSYTPVATDVGNHLMVTATYTDGMGSGKRASASITTAVVDVNAAPEFAAATDTRELAENMPSGTPVGSPITANDPNGNNLTYGVSGADAASFTVADEGQLQTSASFDYEVKSSYSVTITATDPEGLSGSIAVTVNVTNVDEGGMVSLSPTRPSVGTPITASVTDPDSAPTGMTYQWSYSTAMGGPFTPLSGRETRSASLRRRLTLAATCASRSVTTTYTANRPKVRRRRWRSFRTLPPRSLRRLQPGALPRTRLRAWASAPRLRPRTPTTTR